MPKQNCPLCGSPAGYEPDDYGRRKKFDCPKCKYFFVSPSTEEKINNLPKNEKIKLSKESSQCKESEVLKIITDDNGIIQRNCEGDKGSKGIRGQIFIIDNSVKMKDLTPSFF